MKRRFGGAPTGIRAIEKQMKKQQNEFKIKVQSKEWENAKPLEEIEVPEQFAKSQALRLWFLARCNAQGTFDAMAPETEMAHMRHHMLMMMPVPRFWRRLGIALQLIPIIGPQVLHLIWSTAGPQIVLQLVCETLFGFVPAWSSWAQGQLVDCVQRSLYAKGEVPSDELIRKAIVSLIAGNLVPILNALLVRNAIYCQKTLGTKLQRINLQLHLDLDLPSTTDPTLNRMLTDSGNFIDPSHSGGADVGFSQGASGGITQFNSIVGLLSSIANVGSSVVLFVSNFKMMLEFGISWSSFLFLFLASWPILSSQWLMKRRSLSFRGPDQASWMAASGKMRTFAQLGTSFQYKQEVLLFGLRDWVVDSWEKYREESYRLNPATSRTGNQQFMNDVILNGTLPYNVVKDVLHLLMGLHFFSSKITLGSLHIVQTTITGIYYQLMGFKGQFEAVIESILCMAAFFEIQAWIDQRETGDRTVEYKPRIPATGEKRGMKIEARNLTFTYPGGKTPVLKNVNLLIEPGQTLAIVGFNGGGKTTLAKILTGIFDYEGSLLIDGIEANKYTRSSLHKYTTVTPQAFNPFPLTLRENIGLGQISEIDNLDAIQRAAGRGGAEEVLKVHGLESLLSGIGMPIMQYAQPAAEPTLSASKTDEEKEKVKSEKTKVGESDEPKAEKNEKMGNGTSDHGPLDETKQNGTSHSTESDKKEGSPTSEKPSTEKKEEKEKEDPAAASAALAASSYHGYVPAVSLSGGQLQRVALSRAFMRADDATLVVLDEPSSALDARAEHELFQRIYGLSSGENSKTTVYISHRFSTVRRADKIAVVEDGTITEVGSHTELMALQGRYAEFFTLQAAAFQ